VSPVPIPRSLSRSAVLVLSASLAACAASVDNAQDGSTPRDTQAPQDTQPRRDVPARMDTPDIDDTPSVVLYGGPFPIDSGLAPVDAGAPEDARDVIWGTLYGAPPPRDAR
jgi:hypothetical protein